jgi:diguanylate cyclase (GGDEF)-like protein
MLSVAELLSNDMAKLEATARDWASWDNTYDFINDSNQQYINANLIDNSFENLGLNFMLFTDINGNIVFKKSYDLENARDVEIPQDLLDSFAPGSRLLKYEDSSAGNTGIIMLKDNPMLITSLPVLRSDGTGPYRGSMVWGYYINEPVMARVSRTLGLTLQIIKINEGSGYDSNIAGIINSINSQLNQTSMQSTVKEGAADTRPIYLEPVDRKKINGYLLVDDIFGKQALLFKSEMPRDIYSQGFSSLILLSIMILVGGFTIGTVLVLILDRWVLKRILALSLETKEIEAIPDSTRNLKVAGRDEISNLTTEINSMLYSIRKHKAMLTHLATHDSLTGIANRRIFESELSRAIAKASRGIKSFLIFLDIDNFKTINDTYGHAFGDKVLISVSQEIKNNIRTEDVVARFGGDEFTVLIEQDSIEKARIAGERLREVISQFNIGFTEENFNFSVSMGMVPIEGFEPPSLLLSWADKAMYEAKTTGKNKLVIFNKGSEIKGDSLEILEHIRGEIDNKRIELHFQPILNLYSREVLYHEALVRLRDKNGDILMPNMFIPLAEKYGFIGKLTLEVLKHVLEMIKKEACKCVFINLSVKCFLDSALLKEIEDEIKQSKIDPALLGFEIAESAMFNDITRVTEWMKKIEKLGCKFAVDDFGTGFSSFSVLSELPFEFFKIDGSIIKAISSDHHHSSMVKSVNILARMLGKKTVAEWIESSEAVNAVKELGIEYGQGYHFGMPGPEIKTS